MCFRPYFTNRFTYFWATLYVSTVSEGKNLGRLFAVAAKFVMWSLIF
jgi:hypothetical protein